MGEPAGGVPEPVPAVGRAGSWELRVRSPWSQSHCVFWAPSLSLASACEELPGTQQAPSQMVLLPLGALGAVCRIQSADDPGGAALRRP